MALFLSTFVNKIDKKGRVSVPASFRNGLSKEAFFGIIAFRSYKYPAVEVCDYERMHRLMESLDTLEIFSETQDDLTASIFADAEQLPFDGEGRVTLTPALIDHIHVTDQVAFVGRGATFQMWQPDNFRSYQAEARKRAQGRPLSFSLQGSSPQRSRV